MDCFFFGIFFIILFCCGILENNWEMVWFLLVIVVVCISVYDFFDSFFIFVIFSCDFMDLFGDFVYNLMK